MNEIIKLTQIPKSTIYDHIRDIPLSLKAEKRIKFKKKIAIQKLREFSQKRKGKCLPGRKVIKPKGWSNNLILLTAHLLFDGEITSHRCVYHNRNLALINRVKILFKDIFNLKPVHLFYKESGVHRISYFYVELANYFQNKSSQLKKYIVTSSLEKKKLFLKAFFDDEGSIRFDKKWNKREVGGFQYNLEILKLVQKLLKDFQY